MQRYTLFFILSFVIGMGNDINANPYTTQSTSYAGQDAPTMPEIPIKPLAQETVPDIKKDEGCKCQPAIDELKQENKELHERTETLEQKLAVLEEKCSNNTMHIYFISAAIVVIGLMFQQFRGE